MPEDVAANYAGISPGLMRKLMRDKENPFPDRVQLSPGRVVWLKEDIDAWLDRKAGRPEHRGADRNDPVAEVDDWLRGSGAPALS